MEELSEVLTFLYQREGHTLLTDRQSFSYAIKDIELACGSLLTVHDGVIEVIHATVKEYLLDRKNLTDAAEQYTQLLVDPMAASLELTLTSLEYMSQNLTKPIVGLDTKANRLDLRVDEERLQDRLRQSPLIRYASFNWLLHLIDCEGASNHEVAKVLQRTFDFPVAFYWIEACLILDSSSFLERVRYRLEEVYEWASNEMHEASSSFLDHYRFSSNWCSMILRLVNDYGMFIADRPWEIYILDMHRIFSSNDLGETYQNHGHFTTREHKPILYDDQTLLRAQGKKSPINSFQLQRVPSGQGFFIYDHMHQVFITADDSITCHETLYVQDVKTGSCLTPAVDSEVSQGKISDFATSTDGEYLAIMYRDPIIIISGRISIWQIDSDINSKKRMRAGT